ncbi:hypothetical protein [Haloplanus sp. C73]|uniref:hypothetical protein n=1 Tax=Haloplanus sp. C73 TaxID=3421641 RepID=UPI003EB8B5F7
MPATALQTGAEMPAAFQILFVLVPLLVAALGFAIAAVPHRLARWRIRGADGTAQVDPNQTLLLVIRIGGVVVAIIALLMAFGASGVMF